MNSWHISFLSKSVFYFSLAVSCAGCASLFGGPDKSKEEAELHMRMGTAMLEQGKYPNGLRELLQAEELDPKSAAIQNNLGLAYFLRDHPEIAVVHLKRAVELDPKFTDARNNYARVLIELGRYNEAIAQLGKVLQDLTYGDPGKALVNMGMAKFRKGDWQGARTDLAEALRFNRENCSGQTLYGRTLIELGEFDNAARSLDNAVAICQTSKFDEPYYFSGLAYYRLGKTSSAIARMEEVIQVNPDGAYAKKAQSLLKLMK